MLKRLASYFRFGSLDQSDAPAAAPEIDWIERIETEDDTVAVFDDWRLALPDREVTTFPVVKLELAAFSRAFRRGAHGD